ncbi:esterase [Methylovorus sp. MM2]|uniref:alpha/beta hydrolase n=1 Tax=Methylovorus sp. MM2 TaxID=1848038 RepID=UPI0007DE5F51|nr:alpha/beta hydrolase [Methylovorus sp. MM2]OAM51457.1 esterase [Methylovorus sp. MM2]
MRYALMILTSLLLLGFQPVQAGPLLDLLEGDGSEVSTPLSAKDLPEGIKLLKDVSYGNAKLQSMDVYVPVNATNAPIILMVHGGGWKHGDKNNSRVVKNKVARWVNKGFIFISVNYPMLPESMALQQAQDIALALATVQKKAVDWGGDASKLILMGHSAGAHLVSLISSQPSLASSFGAKPWLGTISLDSAALDVPLVMNKRHLGFYDEAFGKDMAYWKSTSPIDQVTKQSLPLLAVCSTKRRDKPCIQAYAYVAKEKVLGIKAAVLEQDLRHSEINEQLGLDSPYTASVEGFMAELDSTVAEKLAVTKH